MRPPPRTSVVRLWGDKTPMSDVLTATIGIPVLMARSHDDGELRLTRILIVDDHRSFADLLSAALDTVPGMRCVGTASSAAQGLARAVALRPDIVVMDIQMARQDGLQATRHIRDAVPETLVAVVTAHRDPDWVSRAA